MDDGRLRLRSYRLAFALERRIHRIDTFRIPLPYGLPLASLGWAVGAFLALLMLGGAPLVGGLLALLPWPVRLIFVPGLVAHLLSRMTDDGRPLHEALVARLLFLVRPASRLGLGCVDRVRPSDLGPLPVVPDERAPEYRAAAIRGPGSLLLRQPGRLLANGRVLHLVPAADGPMLHPRELRLLEGQRLVVG